MRSSQLSLNSVDPAPPMTLSELERFFDEETRLYQSMARDMGIHPE